MANILRKFRLMLWKNILVRRRHWILTLFEFLLPVLLFVLLVFIRTQTGGTLGTEYITDATIYDPDPERYIVGQINFHKIAYTPNNSFTYELMEKVKSKLEYSYTRPYGKS